MRAGHPTEALVEFIGAVGTHVREPGAAAAFFLFVEKLFERTFLQLVEPRSDGATKTFRRRDMNHVFFRPARRFFFLPIIGDAHLQQCGFPRVGEDGRPDQPQPALWIDE
jgi:hypothetical protein